MMMLRRQLLPRRGLGRHRDRQRRQRRRRRSSVSPSHSSDPSSAIFVAVVLSSIAAVLVVVVVVVPCIVCLTTTATITATTTAVRVVDAFTATTTTPIISKQRRDNRQRRDHMTPTPTTMIQVHARCSADVTSVAAATTTTKEGDNINEILQAAKVQERRQRWRRTIHLPFTSTLETTTDDKSTTATATTTTTTQSVLSAFDDVVDYYSNFLIPSTSDNDDDNNNNNNGEDDDRRSEDSSTTRSCWIPAFGENAQLVLTKTMMTPVDGTASTTASSCTNTASCDNSPRRHHHQGFTMYIDGIDSDDDFQFLCNKLWDVRLYVDSWKDCMLDITPLRTVVADALNERQDNAPVGYDAATADWAGSSQVSDLFELHNVDALDELYDKGFTVIDTPWTTSHKSHDKMSKYLTDITDQGDHVRRDKVHFLTSDQAETCGLLDQYQLLMGVAHYLNVNYDETTTATTVSSSDIDCSDNDSNDQSSTLNTRSERMIYTDTISSTFPAMAGGRQERRSFHNTPHQPVSPGTSDRPLSIPNDIQLAEYGHNDFYVAHSDNSLQAKSSSESTASTSTKSSSSWVTETERKNHRHLTCILYMNDDWNKHEDGGALRIYPGSRNVMEPRQVLGNNAGKKTEKNPRATSTEQHNRPAWDHVEISPKNGRMILFDSCLIHSVQAVTSVEKVRRALTIWIYRPENNAVKGEQFY